MWSVMVLWKASFLLQGSQGPVYIIPFLDEKVSVLFSHENGIA